MRSFNEALNDFVGQRCNIIKPDNLQEHEELTKNHYKVFERIKEALDPKDQKLLLELDYLNGCLLAGEVAGAYKKGMADAFLFSRVLGIYSQELQDMTDGQVS